MDLSNIPNIPPHSIDRKEIGVIRMKSAIEAIFIALQSSFATAATLVSMATMVAGGLPLTVQDVFTVYSLMSAARKPVLEDFARAVRYFAESLVTLKRVETLLNLSEDAEGTGDASTDAGQGNARCGMGQFSREPSLRAQMHGFSVLFHVKQDGKSVWTRLATSTRKALRRRSQTVKLKTLRPQGWEAGPWRIL